jgi:hypothetical protein
LSEISRRQLGIYKKFSFFSEMKKKNQEFRKKSILRISEIFRNFKNLLDFLGSSATITEFQGFRKKGIAASKSSINPSVLWWFNEGFLRFLRVFCDGVV